MPFARESGGIRIPSAILPLGHPHPVILTKVRIQSNQAHRIVTLDPDFRQDDAKKAD